MKHREFIYVGDPVLGINEKEHVEFILNVQKAILFSLKKKGLLTSTQCERCLDTLEKEDFYE